MKHYVELKNTENDLAQKISKLPLFEDMDDRDAEKIMNEIKILDIEKDDYVFKSGDPAAYMYIIYEGRIKIYYNSIDGKEQIFYIYRAGDFVGGLNLLEHSSYLYMGQALTHCKVVEVPIKTFNEHFVNSPKVLQSLLHKSFERIRWAEDLIQTLSASNASMKTAALLLRLKNSIGVETEDGIKLEIAMSREELGNYSGLARETITRKLGEFKELGYIDLKGNRVIIIKDLEPLRNLVF